jgi:hypothetical protein
LAEMMQAHLHESFPSVLETRADAPATLDTVLARMTAKDSEARFATPNEVVNALTSFARGGDLKKLLPAVSPQGSGRTTIEPASRKPDKDDARPWAIASPLPVQLASSGKADVPKARRSTPGRRKPHWNLSPALWAVLLLLGIAAAKFLMMIFSDPTIVLMDTTAEGGVYDKEDRDSGASNTDKLSQVLKEISPNGIVAMPVSKDWARDNEVVRKRPDVVVIHRSLFFHTVNAELKLDKTNAMWQVTYDLHDEKLRLFIGYVGSEVPDTHFLIYSRGTDKRWMDENFRTEWVTTLENRFPVLKGRIHTIVIPNDQKGSFKDPATQGMMQNLVTGILKNRNWGTLALREPWIMLPLFGAGLGLILTYYAKKK